MRTNLGVLAGLLVVPNDARNVLQGSLARLAAPAAKAVCPRAVGLGAGPHGREPAIELLGCGTPLMPQLQVDAPTARVHGVSHQAPARSLLLRVRAGSVGEAARLLADDSGLGNQQARVCARSVHGSHHGVGGVGAGVCAAARQRSQDDAVWEVDCAETQGLEKGRHSMEC
jgi:hypothetical protein